MGRIPPTSIISVSAIVFCALPAIPVCLDDFLVGDREDCDITLAGASRAHRRFGLGASISESTACRRFGRAKDAHVDESGGTRWALGAGPFEASAGTREEFEGLAVTSHYRSRHGYWRAMTLRRLWKGRVGRIRWCFVHVHVEVAGLTWGSMPSRIGPE